MRKIKLYEQNLKDENGKKREFHYYLLAEEIETEGFFCENYGVMVSEPTGESSDVFGITIKRERAEKLVDFLSRHKVSPVTLLDVVADWL